MGFFVAFLPCPSLHSGSEDPKSSNGGQASPRLSQASGKEILVLQDASIYQGTVQDGQPHGTGTWTSIEGECYEGEWKWGKRHGKGKCSWSDGET